MNSYEFAKKYNVSDDFLSAVGNREVAVLEPGQKGNYAGFDAVVVGHIENTLWEIKTTGGVTFCSSSEFESAPI